MKLDKAKKRDKKRHKKRHGMRTSGHSLKWLEQMIYDRAVEIAKKRGKK